MATKYIIHIADLTLDQQDEIARLIESGRAGHVSAVVYVALKQEMPAITLAHVKTLTQREVELIKPEDEPEQHLDDPGGGDSPTYGP